MDVMPRYTAHMPPVLSADLERRLRALLTVFLDENSRVNLSAHRTEERCWTGNILDSLPLLDLLPELTVGKEAPRSVLDIGTGGGFPALPLAIARPDLHITAMDSTGKKIAAVQRMAERLGLPHLTAVTGRAETLGRTPAFRRHFDIVTARAVADTTLLLRYSAPFVRPGGWIVLWKSMHIAEELRASEAVQRQLRCILVRTVPYVLGDAWGERQLLLFQKK